MCVRNRRNLKACIISLNKATEMLQEASGSVNRHQAAWLLSHCQLYRNFKPPLGLPVIN